MPILRGDVEISSCYRWVYLVRCVVGQWIVGWGVGLLGWVVIRGVVYGGPWYRCSVYGCHFELGGGVRGFFRVSLTSSPFSGYCSRRGFCLHFPLCAYGLVRLVFYGREKKLERISGYIWRRTEATSFLNPPISLFSELYFHFSMCLEFNAQEVAYFVKTEILSLQISHQPPHYLDTL